MRLASALRVEPASGPLVGCWPSAVECIGEWSALRCAPQRSEALARGLPFGGETRRRGGLFAVHSPRAGRPLRSDGHRFGPTVPVTCDTGRGAGVGGWRIPSRPQSRRQSRSSLRPVLKHGPRSLAYARVTGCLKTQRRNESEASPLEGDMRSGGPRVAGRSSPVPIACDGAAEERMG